MPDPLSPPQPPVEGTHPPSLAHDYRACRTLAGAHYENFPTAVRLLPHDLRDPVGVLYAFARGADDLADEGRAGPGERLAALDRWERRLDEALAGRPEGPLFRALADMVQRHRLPVGLLRDLLSAFRQDVTVNRYATFADLRRYTRRSADPVGRLVLRLAGHDDAGLDRLADAICTGLQLANFWQDLSVDRRRGRLYLPLEDLDRHGCDPGEVLAGRGGPAFRNLLADEIVRTRALLDEGAALAPRLGGRLGWWVRLVRRGGRAILARISRLGPRVLQHRPVLGGWSRLATGLAVLGDGLRGR
jgi:squalene synthase HpnC